MLNVVSTQSLPQRDKQFRFHPDHLALFELSPVAEQVYLWLIAHPGGNPLEHFGVSIKEVVNELFTADLIRPNGRPATAHPRSNDNPLRSLALNVSQSCNLSCKYCFADLAPSGRRMELETAVRSVDYLLAASGPVQPVNLTFFGGEPLLNFSLIRDTVAYAQEQSAKISKTVRYSITTNATLITPEIADFFEAHRVGVTVSLDGGQTDQDRNRPFVSGRGSYDVVASKLGVLLERVKSRPVAARVTLTRGCSPVEETLEELLGMGFFEVGFSPVTDEREEFHLSPEEMEGVLQAFGRLSRRFVDAAVAGGYFGFSNLANMLGEIDEGQPRPYACGAGLGLLGVDYRGDLFLCHRFAGQAEFKLGSVTQGADPQVAQRWVQELHVENRPGECQTCWIRYLCAGGCYHEAQARQNDYRVPNLHACDFLRTWTRMGLEAYLELSERAPAFLDRIRGLS